LQLRVLRLGFLQDGDVGVGVFPEGEEIFVGGERPNAGRIGIRAPCEVFDCKAFARAIPRCANAPVQQFQTMPLWSRIFSNSAAAALPCPAAKYDYPHTPDRGRKLEWSGRSLARASEDQVNESRGHGGASKDSSYDFGNYGIPAIPWSNGRIRVTGGVEARFLLM